MALRGVKGRAGAGAKAGADWGALAGWLRAGGGASAALALEPAPIGPGGPVVRGLVAREPLAEGATILSVPLNLAFGAAHAEGASTGELAESLLAECAKDGGGANGGQWAEYLRSLPASLATPITLADADVGELQYAPAVAAVADFKAYVAAMHAGGGAGGRYSLEEFTRAVQMVHSRTFRTVGRRVMVPGIDMLNHGGPRLQNCTLRLARPFGTAAFDDTQGVAIQLVALRDLAEGEQVLWSYGSKRSNDDFCQYYGMVVPDNDYETVALFGDVDEALAWHKAAFGAEAAEPYAGALAASRAQDLGGTARGAVENGADIHVLDALDGDPAAPQRPAAELRADGSFTLASFRTHLPQWGTPAPRAAPAELIACPRSGLVDVRLAAAFRHLAAAGAGPSTGAEALRRRAAELRRDRERAQELRGRGQPA